MKMDHDRLPATTDCRSSEAGIYEVVHGYRPGVVCGYRLCTRCFERGFEHRATHVVVHNRRWWQLTPSSEAICESCVNMEGARLSSADHGVAAK